MLGPNDLMLRDYVRVYIKERLGEAEAIRLSRHLEQPHERFYCRFVVRLGAWLVELGTRLQAQHALKATHLKGLQDL